jgi:hypothetical protein
MTAGRQILFGHIAAETPHDSTNNKKPTVVQTDDLVKMAGAQILPQNAIQSSFKQIHFLICETCFWCASLLYEIADHTTFLNCRTCEDRKIHSYELTITQISELISKQ